MRKTKKSALQNAFKNSLLKHRYVFLSEHYECKIYTYVEHSSMFTVKKIELFNFYIVFFFFTVYKDAFELHGRNSTVVFLFLSYRKRPTLSTLDCSFPIDWELSLKQLLNRRICAWWFMWILFFHILDLLIFFLPCCMHISCGFLLHILDFFFFLVACLYLFFLSFG